MGQNETPMAIRPEKRPEDQPFPSHSGDMDHDRFSEDQCVLHKNVVECCGMLWTAIGEHIEGHGRTNAQTNGDLQSYIESLPKSNKEE